MMIFFCLFLIGPWHRGQREKESEVTQSCQTLLDDSLQGFSVHEIFQAGILGWVAISFSRGSSRPRDQTWVGVPH